MDVVRWCYEFIVDFGDDFVKISWFYDSLKVGIEEIIFVCFRKVYLCWILKLFLNDCWGMNNGSLYLVCYIIII